SADRPQKTKKTSPQVPINHPYIINQGATRDAAKFYAPTLIPTGRAITPNPKNAVSKFLDA
ncbi:MAG: hypothetical protein ACRCX9_00380, partial [Plesiomonas shigelloides]